MSMSDFTESVVEQAALHWFEGLCCEIAHGPDIAPEGPASERETFGEVVLLGRLRDALEDDPTSRMTRSTASPPRPRRTPRGPIAPTARLCRGPVGTRAPFGIHISRPQSGDMAISLREIGLVSRSARIARHGRGLARADVTSEPFRVSRGAGRRAYWAVQEERLCSDVSSWRLRQACRFAGRQPQRGCVLQPRVAAKPLPWVCESHRHQPQRGCVRGMPQPRWG